MRIGWTATRHLTDELRAWITDTIHALPIDATVITGGCVGGDAYIARVASERGMDVHAILPANRSQVDPEWAQYCTTVTQMPEGSTYRDRNAEIVRVSGWIYAAPAHPEHDPRSRRSGTWMTVRIARREGVPIRLPDWLEN